MRNACALIQQLSIVATLLVYYAALKSVAIMPVATATATATATYCLPSRYGRDCQPLATACKPQMILALRFGQELSSVAAPVGMSNECILWQSKGAGKWALA